MKTGKSCCVQNKINYLAKRVFLKKTDFAKRVLSFFCLTRTAAKVLTATSEDYLMAVAFITDISFKAKEAEMTF